VTEEGKDDRSRIENAKRTENKELAAVAPVLGSRNMVRRKPHDIADEHERNAVEHNEYEKV
jgi:hypothetical protein